MIGARAVVVALFLVGLSVIILLPLASLVAASFTTAPPGVPSDITVSNYVEVYTDPAYYRMLLNSLSMGAGAAAFSVVVGTGLAWIISRTDTPMTRTLESIIVAPLIMSPFVGAIAWTLLLSPRAGLINVYLMSIFNLRQPLFNVYSHLGLIWVLGLYLTPYMFLFVSASLKSMDPALEEASYALGAGHLRTALRVTLPMSLPAIASGSILIFVLAIEMFSVPAVIGVPGGIYVLTTQIFSYLSSFPPRYGAATVTGILLLVITIVGVFAQRRVMMRKEFYVITGKGYRPRLVELRGLKYATFALCVVYVVLAVVLPIYALIIQSLLPYFSPDFTWESFTLANYIFVFFEFPKTILAIRNTIFLAGFGATVGMILSLTIAYLVNRTNARGRSALEYISNLPIAVPAMVLALAMLWVWVTLPVGLYGTIWILLIAYITRFLPWGFRAATAAVVQVHPELEESSRILGASTLRTFRSIIVPLAKFGLISGWVLLFMLFAKELSASILLYSAGSEVISVAMFDLWENGDYGPVSALTLAQVMIVLIPLLIVQRIGGKISFG